LIDEWFRHTSCSPKIVINSWFTWNKVSNSGHASLIGCKSIQYRILIADDEFLTRWSLAQALSQEGHEVVAVENGEKAIEAAKTQHFDFIITDLVMPEPNGWEVLETLQQIQPLPRVIIITAHGGEDTERVAKEKGAWAYIEKPYIIDQIKEILKEGPREEVGSSLNEL
jgi:DNA-binding NtrC family response regulator